jgi:hypothetical protein
MVQAVAVKRACSPLNIRTKERKLSKPLDRLIQRENQHSESQPHILDSQILLINPIILVLSFFNQVMFYEYSFAVLVFQTAAWYAKRLNGLRKGFISFYLCQLMIPRLQALVLILDNAHCHAFAIEVINLTPKRKSAAKG